MQHIAKHNISRNNQGVKGIVWHFGNNCFLDKLDEKLDNWGKYEAMSAAD